MCGPLTRTPACLILYGRGGVAGEVVGVVAEGVASAGAGSGGTGTLGDKGKIS